MRLSFHGAAGGVTGSCHLLETGGRRLLVDCGLFQGEAHEDERNRAPFGFDAASIDAVVLTHAHLDHCGRLPLLVRRGLRGRIHATAPTRDLARLVLLDTARLAASEARRERKRNGGRAAPKPIFDDLDVLDALDAFAAPVDYDVPFEILPGVRVTFLDAGHILGSASVVVEAEGKRVVFSGDVGNVGKPLVRDPTWPPPSDVAILETTYGERNHKPFDESVRELFDAVQLTTGRGGKLLVPSFAIARAQELLYVLREGIEAGELPSDLPVYLDSPMAHSAMRLHARHAYALDARARAIYADGRDPFAIPGLRIATTGAASRAIARRRGGAVIVAGSGMCNGGRIVAHLARELARPESGVVFVSYAPPGTLARRIIDGESEVRVMGRSVHVRAQRFTIGGFSAHAGRDELAAWHRASGAMRTFLVHGTDGARSSLAAILPGRIERPLLGEAYEA